MSADVVLVDYGVGNTASVTRALRRLGAGVDFTSDPARVSAARRIVLPGVGAFAPARESLSASGLDAALRAAVGAGARLLGLCLGFQLLFEESAEQRVTPGLGFLRGKVAPFPEGVRSPHVGWNALDVKKPEGLMAGLPPGSYVYFVHSFRPEGADPADVAATSDHGGPFVAAVQRENVWGCQFHPEKSSGAGRVLLANFLAPEAA